MRPSPSGSASWSNPSASWMPLAAVAMALVPPAIFLPGCGSKVSSWLGPPPSQSRMTDCAGPRVFSACCGQKLADGRQPGEPGQLEEAAAVESNGRERLMTDPQWLQENSVVFSRAQKRSVNRSLRTSPVAFAEPPVKWESSSGVGPPREHGEERGFDGRAVVGGKIGDLAGGGEQAVA